MHRPSPSLVIASAALFVSLGGTGYAAVTLKRGSVTSREIHDGSVRARDLAPGVRAALGVPGPKGEQGSRGAAGIDGQRGAEGPAGKDGADAVSGPPAPGNASFDVDTASWQLAGSGSFARTTDDFDSAPAAGKWSPASYGTVLIEKFTGTFWAGRTYVLHFALKQTAQTVPAGDPTVTADFGVAGTDAARSVVTATATFADYQISWTPTAARSSVTLRLSRPHPGTYVVDSLALSV